MKLVPLALHIPFFVFVIMSVAIAIPFHEVSANDFLSGRFLDEGQVDGPPPSAPNSYYNALCCLVGETYGPPLPPPPSEPDSYEEVFCCLTRPDPRPNWSLGVASPFPDMHQVQCHNLETGLFLGGGITTTAEGDLDSTCAIVGWTIGF